MVTSTRLSITTLLFPLIIGYVAVRPNTLWGGFPRLQEPSPIFTGKTILEPPQQKTKWDSPASRIPGDFVNAALLLFDQGLADPRGCEYRAIKVTTGTCWTGDAGVVQTRGWVLPAQQGDKHRFAVCWNGLVYPLVSVGASADLAKDVKKAIELKKNEKERDDELESPESEEGWSLWHGNPENLGTALLLRLGEGNLASQLWAANHPPSKKEDQQQKQDETDPYLALAASWAWTQFDRALGAHMRRDDVLALHSFRRLSLFAEKVEGEAKNRGVKPQKDQAQVLSFLRQLPELLADQERRANGRMHEAIVCIGPGREPDQKKRIAALISRLNEVSARQMGQPGGVDLGGDPVVQALIREGEPAVEPLLKCFEEDHRLTRSVYFWRAFARTRTCLSVHEAAYVALSGILVHADFEHTVANLTSDDEETRKALAHLIREHLKTAKRMSPAHSWFAILSDDKSKPEEWLEAAKRIVSPDDEDSIPGRMLWPESWMRTQKKGDKSKLVGESLRDIKNPAVTDLLLKRIKQSDSIHISANLALALSLWEPKAALQPLAEQMKRLQEEEKWREYVLLVERRCELDDLKALDDYIDFIGTVTPMMLGDATSFNVFSPLIDHLKHPGMAQAAEKLFGDAKSPWLPILQKDPKRPGASKVPELISTALLREPNFRKAVLKELANKGGHGTVQVKNDGWMAMNLPGIDNSSGGGSWWRQFDIPEEGVKGNFRNCDYVAWKIAEENEAAPRCELYWSEENRDKAVAACADFLRRYGDHLFLRQEAFVQNKPATARDVGDGKAVFSLEREGETRLVKGLKLPVDARWATLKNRPHQEEVTDLKTRKKTLITGYRQTGKVVQAEEVKAERGWRRYYGFVGCNRIARVPAEDIEFPPDEPWSWQTKPHIWVSLGSGFYGMLNVATRAVEPFEKLPPRLSVEADLTFSITLWNARGLDQASPTPEKTLRLRLLYSPEVVSPQGSLGPKAIRESEWIELAPGPGAQFTAKKDKTLAPTETMTLATVDVRKWFNVNHLGFYRLLLVPVQVPPEGAPIVPAEVLFSLGPSKPKPGNAK